MGAVEGDYLILSYQPQGRFQCRALKKKNLLGLRPLQRLAALLGVNELSQTDEELLASIADALGIGTSSASNAELSAAIRQRLSSKREMRLVDLLPSNEKETAEEALRRLGQSLS